MEDIKSKIAELVQHAAINHHADDADEFVRLLTEQKRLESALKSFCDQLSKIKQSGQNK